LAESKKSIDVIYHNLPWNESTIKQEGKEFHYKKAPSLQSLKEYMIGLKK